MQKKLQSFTLLILLIIVSFNGLCQTSGINQQSNLASIQVDKLTDEQVKQIVDKAQASGYNQQQIESMALAKGMSPTEVAKLKERVSRMNLYNSKTKIDTSTTKGRIYLEKNDIFNEVLEDKELKKEKELEKKIFGYSIFKAKNLTFEPSLNLPTPQNYQIGPGDQLIVDIWGASQSNYKLNVSPEGSIFIENVGPVNINGLTIENAGKRIISRLSAIYAGLNGTNPNTFAQVSLGNLRSIKVSILGEVKTPGTYNLSSLSTVFNALYVCGGPNINGSLRKIDVYRDSKLVSSLDGYDFILKGDQKSNIRLQDQDVIIVRPYLSRVEVKGEVKLPAIYEIKENEHLQDLINFTGGFTDKAYTYRLKVDRNNDREHEIEDVEKSKFATFKIESGDVVSVDSILKRYSNRVAIKGAVYRPGEFRLDSGMTIKQLISKAEGIRGDAFTTRAILYRTNTDLTVSSQSINLNDLFKGNSDIALQKDDSVRIFSISELQEVYKLNIVGEVQKPGKYPFVKNMTLEDLIALSGGLKESGSLANIEIARRIKNSDPTSVKADVAEIYLFSISKDLRLSDSASQFALEPYDQVFIRRSPGYTVQELVEVFGEVLYPGKYSIENKGERISDLLSRSGGLTHDAYPKGACLVRKIPVDQKQREQLMNSLKQNTKATIQLNEEAKNKVDSLKPQIDTTQKFIEQRIGIDLVKIINKPHSEFDLILQEGDILKIPKELQTVKLSGALLYPVTVRYDKGNSLKSYISMAGGYGEEARRSKTFVIYANGSVRRTKQFFGIKFYPNVEPGAEIIVPFKPETERMSAAEKATIAMIVVQASYIITQIVNNIKWK